MAWTTPRTWTTSEIVTKAIMDTHVRDNLQYLKDVLDGTASQTVKLLGVFRQEAATVSHMMKETDAATDEKVWQWVVSGGQLILQAINDAENSGGGNVFLIDRTANDLAYMAFGNAATPPFKVDSAGVVLFGPGAVGAPGLAFYNDADTGIYSSGANTLDFATAGAQRARITSAGVWVPGLSASAGLNFLGTTTQIAAPASDQININLAGNTRFQFFGSGSIYGESAPYLFATAARLIVAVDSVVPFVVDRGANDGVLISLRQGGTEEGSISVSGTVVAFNTFMGAHFTQLKAGQDEPPQGAVVVTTGEIVQSDNVHYIEDVVEVVPEADAARSARAAQATRVREVRHDRRQGPGSSAWREVRGETKDYLPHISGTTTEGDPAVYGVWIGQVREDAAGGSFGKNGRPVYNVAGVGTYECRVTDSGGDIAPGDLLCASARMYEAQRQADDVIRAGTLGKALSGVKWDDVPLDRALGYKWRLVSVALYCG